MSNAQSIREIFSMKKIFIFLFGTYIASFYPPLTKFSIQVLNLQHLSLTPAFKLKAFIAFLIKLFRLYSISRTIFLKTHYKISDPIRLLKRVKGQNY